MDYKFNKVLLGYDNSAASKVALDKALQTCKAFHSDLYVVHVNSSKSSDSDFKDEVLSKASAYGIQIHYIQKSGNVSKEISHTEREIGADLIFMGSHGVQGFQPYWIGSNAMRVVSSASCPVITVQEDSANADFSKILLPLDDSIETRQKVPYANVFSKVFNATIHVLSVSKSSSEETTRRIVAYANQTVNYLEERNVKIVRDIRQGADVPNACIEYAKENNIGLILMMAETESSSWFMGTYAQQLVNHSPIPVMSIHGRDLLLADAPGY